MTTATRRSTTALVDHPGIEEVVERELVRSLYQPIVDLDSDVVVAYEALARGPVGSPLERPDHLFEAARHEGVVTTLDWACRAAAVRGALRAGLGRGTRLFVNIEPASFRAPRPSRYDDLFGQALQSLDIVVEVTERELLRDPAALVETVHQARALGFGVAIDDVGADPCSLALLPFVEPDVIKLDMRMVRERADGEIAAIAAAVQADAERRGATILAEGIETELHLRRARLLGAHLGQGWLFGHPDELPEQPHVQPTASGRAAASRHAVAPTPWSLVEARGGYRTATKSLLLPMSHHIEQRAVSRVDPYVVLGAFQDAAHFTPATMRRYEGLAAHCPMVGAIGAGMSTRAAPGVRVGTLAPGHALIGEWTVAVVSQHDAVALIARDRGDGGPEAERRFDYVITYDRATVVAAARSLMQHIDAD